MSYISEYNITIRGTSFWTRQWMGFFHSTWETQVYSTHFWKKKINGRTHVHAEWSKWNCDSCEVLPKQRRYYFYLCEYWANFINQDLLCPVLHDSDWLSICYKCEQISIWLISFDFSAFKAKPDGPPPTPAKNQHALDPTQDPRPTGATHLHNHHGYQHGSKVTEHHRDTVKQHREPCTGDDHDTGLVRTGEDGGIEDEPR